MTRGGFRAGAGRKNGSIQGFAALSKENQALVEAALSEFGSNNNQLPADISPLDFLLHVMRNNTAPMAIRLQAATVAAPYVHPRLTSSKVTVQKESNLSEILDELKRERDQAHGSTTRTIDHVEPVAMDLFSETIRETVEVVNTEHARKLSQSIDSDNIPLDTVK